MFIDRSIVGKGAYHKLLLDLAKKGETWLKLKVVVCIGLSDGSNNGNVVTLWTDHLGRRNHGNVDV